ncbi:MAG: NB-ARC domain-containing protein [Cyanobacteria bacterium P01_E01_bin.6]
MTREEALRILDVLQQQDSSQPGLSDLQISIFLRCWDGASYSSISEDLQYESDYIKKVGAQLWRDVSSRLGKKVSKKNVQSVFRGFSKQRQQTSVQRVDGDLVRKSLQPPSGDCFWGRTSELQLLQRWRQDPNCSAIAIIGMGGVGKTALARNFIKAAKQNYEAVVWCSVIQSPLCTELLAEILHHLCDQQSQIPQSFEAQLSCLEDHISNRPCLVVIDNFESILQQGVEGGLYREGYKQYRQLLDRICIASHPSCIVITCREKPEGLSNREGNLPPFRILQLKGLLPSDGQAILQHEGLQASAADFNQLIRYYGGNPLALKVVSSTIRSLFCGDVQAFWEQGLASFGNIWDLLKQQHKRLSSLEKQVMYWLAIDRELVSMVEIQEDLFPKVPPRDLLIALDSLQSRSAIETSRMGFTLQPVVMEFTIDLAIQNLHSEIINQSPQLLVSFSFLKARTKDYIREAQTRLIFEPLIDRLLENFPHKQDLIHHLKSMLFQQRNLPLKQVGYAGGNLLNLLCYLQTDLKDIDLSHLVLWQAYLPHINLQRANLSFSNVDKSVFADTFGGITAIAFSSDGRLMAIGDTGGGITLWNVRTGRKILIYEGHQFWVWSLHFSPDSQTLLSSGDDYLVKIWDVCTDRCLRVMQGHELTVPTAIYSPSGKTIASCSQDETIRIWDPFHIDRPCTRILRGHVKRVWSVAYSPDGKVLASGAEDTTLKLWNPETGDCLRTLTGHVHWVSAVAFSPDGTILASGSFDRNIRLWNPMTGECIAVLQGHTDTVTAIAFSPKGDCLASSSYDRTVKLWNVDTGACLKTLRGHSNRVWSVAFQMDGNKLVSGGDDCKAKIWDLNTGRCQRTIQGHTNITLAVDYHPDRTWLASGHEDQTVRLWDLDSGRLLQTFYGHTNRVWSVAFSPNVTAAIVGYGGTEKIRLLASGSSDGSIRLWHVEQGTCLHTLRGHRSWVWSIAFSGDGLWLASSSYDCTIVIWQVATGACVRVLEGHQGPVSCVKFGPDDRLLATSGFDYKIKLWSFETGECVKTLKGHSNNVWSVAFSPDGRELASSSYDRSIKRWDLETGECIQTIEVHSGPVIPIHYSPDGRYLLTGSYDRTIVLWDLAKDCCQTKLLGHKDVVVSLGFTSRSLPIVVSGSFDETIKVWNLETENCLHNLRVPRPYEGMEIEGIVGLTAAQEATLVALGARGSLEKQG